jgi:GntR family transcriptional regulator, transcriptional repressor for pyruvate dehydrogenase complex
MRGGRAACQSRSAVAGPPAHVRPAPSVAGSTVAAVQSDPAGQETPAAPARASESTLRALRPTERRKLPHDVADQLLDLIASSTGSEITLPAERALCEQLSVSRNVLREALAALHQAGVIETRGKLRIAHVGQARARRVARLPRPSDPVLDPMEVRRILEPEVASLAAKRASAEAIREMERYVTLMEEAAARGDAVVDYDSAFHVAIADATGNETLVALVRALNDALRESRELSFGPESAPRQAIADHVAILSAIREKDPVGATAAMRHHLDRVEVLIRDALRTTETGD